MIAAHGERGTKYNELVPGAEIARLKRRVMNSRRHLRALKTAWARLISERQPGRPQQLCRHGPGH
jgi:hypothetical protein